jgi:hypothetical protein
MVGVLTDEALDSLENSKDKRVHLVRPDTLRPLGNGLFEALTINAHFNPALAFNIGVTWSVGNLSKFKVNGVSVPVDSFGMTTARVYFGLIWFVQKK